MSAKRSSERQPLRAFVFDVGLVLSAWAVLVALENLVVGIAYRTELVASWEMGHARLYLSPIALGAVFPLALVVVGASRLAAARHARALAVLAMAFAAVTAGGVSTGRHFASLGVRAAFVGAAALAAGASASWAVRRLRLARVRALAAAGAAASALGWLADAFVLPRLYPAFHTAVFVLTLFGAAATTLAVRDARARGAASVTGLALVTLSLAWTPRAAAAVRGDDNLRRVLVEHAPLLGRAVLVAARIAPPPPIADGDPALTAAALVGARAQASGALDWRGHDLVLVTIDALRADHVSSYGYPRPTTPNIDRLAARGARFTHAYCPTPHTSYSVASMMTGKYARPLLAMGAPEGQGQGRQGTETWPTLLRRYGWRTAAFYPPAVFFIDEHRFEAMRDAGLGFEYRKVEFATPELRRAQVERYLAEAPGDKPLFLWVHIFEPHEPYEMHPEHPFSGDERSDAYDSEVATADALTGDIVAAFERRRPGAVVVVSADHGEELGDHGGRYHGTTVYEEQVRVPLVVVGPGVGPRVVGDPVQTIDLLPTTLAALDIPLPARLRGRDLGALLTGRDREASPPGNEGLAFAETDDWTMLARGADRLLCLRKIGSCVLYDVARDPGEARPVDDRPARVAELRRLTAAIERENGRLEATDTPEALRLCLQGERDAAGEVAPLLDDARVDIRRAAARCAFGLRAPEMALQLRRAMREDEDARVRRWAALALLRLGTEGDDAILASDAALRDAADDADGAAARTAAALAFAERGDGRGEAELVARWGAAFAPGARTPGEVDEARALCAAFGTLHARAAAPVLARSLEDVRLRPHVVDALAAIGDPRARPALLATFAAERYLHVRAAEARALLRLGATAADLDAPLTRFAGVPEPMPEAIGIARDAGLLREAHGGATFEGKPTRAHAKVQIGYAGPARLLVLAAERRDERDDLTARADGQPVATRPAGERTFTAELGERPSGPLALDLEDAAGLLAAWVVPLAPEIPPPPPRAWDAGAGVLESAP
jgi:arylsulfatase A-like enzyme